MITGVVMVVIGLPLGFYGSTKFNLGIMFLGWGIAAAGAAIFLASAIGVP